MENTLPRTSRDILKGREWVSENEKCSSLSCCVFLLFTHLKRMRDSLSSSKVDSSKIVNLCTVDLTPKCTENRSSVQQKIVMLQIVTFLKKKEKKEIVFFFLRFLWYNGVHC